MKFREAHLCKLWKEMLVNIEQQLHELLPAAMQTKTYSAM